MIVYDEFKNYYIEHGMCKGDAFRRKNEYTEAELKTRYRKYRKKHNEDGMTKDQEIRDVVLDRDDGACRLYRILTLQEKAMLTDQALVRQLDCAHVFSKAVYPWMRYNPNNVVLLYRTFHSRLDSYRCPITNEPLNAEQVKGWWQRIVGNETWMMLEDEAKHGR